MYEDRVRILNDMEVDTGGSHVVYWMQQSQRTIENPALDFAIRMASDIEKPLSVVFCLTDTFPEANLRHYLFMLQGLVDVRCALAQRGIGFDIHIGEPPGIFPRIAAEAAAVVTDRGYLRCQKQWRNTVAHNLPIRLYEIECDAIVPVDIASDKEEYSAATIRRKLHPHIDTLQDTPQQIQKAVPSPGCAPSSGISWKKPEDLLRHLRLDRTIPPSSFFIGGQQQAQQHLDLFLKERLPGYAKDARDPTKQVTSELSPYLHFGQISPLTIAQAVHNRRDRFPESVEAYIEELIVRRELSLNFVHHNPAYDRYECLPTWARDTLAEHAKDSRLYTYSFEELETAQTHDCYWNAAQTEMMITGRMHGYMRMYWGKKVIEWSRYPEEAYENLLTLNNKYELDGRDPNAFAGVAWCFGKHDRPWQERPIFGKIRYMNANGLRRKFDIQTYVEHVRDLQ